MAQFKAFSEAAARAAKRALADELINLRAAQFDSADFSKYLGKLTG